MSKRARIVTLVLGILLFSAFLVVLWHHFQPIRTPLRAGMTRDEVRLTLNSDPAHSYSIYSDLGWCSRGIFQLGEWFSYHTWIGYSFDQQSRLDSVYGHHAVTIELPVIGFHDHEFAMRDIALPK